MSRLSTWWKGHGVAVGALTGAKERAIEDAEAVVDVLIFSGTEAGGHCGEVSTMLLILEVVRVMWRIRMNKTLQPGEL